MPFKENLPTLECNIDLAEKRLSYLRQKMERDLLYKEEYTKFMDHVVYLNFCEPVSEEFVSSSPEVLSRLDPCLVSDKVQKINIEDKVQERALGVVWNLQTDSFTYNVSNFPDSSFRAAKFCLLSRLYLILLA